MQAYLINTGSSKETQVRVAVINDVNIALRTSKLGWAGARKVVEERGASASVHAGGRFAHVDNALAVFPSVPCNAVAEVGVNPVLTAYSVEGVAGGTGTIIDVYLAAAAGKPRRAGTDE